MRDTKRDLDKARRAFERSIRTARHSPADPASVREIAEAAGVSKRTVSVIAGEQEGWGDHPPAPGD